MKTVMVELDYYEIMEILKRLNGAPASILGKLCKARDLARKTGGVIYLSGKFTD